MKTSAATEVGFVKLDYRVLGPVEVWADGRQLDIGGARQRRLLGALALAGGRPITAERLIDIVWVGQPPDQARNTLRTYIARARRVLEVEGVAPLLTDVNGWRLEREEDALDSARFESQLAAARAMAADPIAALASVEEALALWRDDAFVEFGTEDWCAGEAVRLDELRLVAQEEKVEAMLGCGLYDDAISELERFIEHHPLRDRPRGQQMVALYRAGRQVEAVRRYQDYRQYLDHEVGVEPSDELRSLEQRIINRDPSLQQLAPAGRQLRGYQLGQQIGEGAFGRIYRASQPALGREVAIKVIRPELADNPEFIRRFDGEAQIIARLEHPHIVPLFDYWREPGGAYLVMRYLRGGTAEQLLESRGSLSVGQVSRIVDEIGSALARAHAAGVVHRDVKPANILFDDLGNSYLGDFGIASDVGSPSRPETDSLTDAVYLSPEQALQGDVAASSDVYAMGVVLFELLTGQTPFPRETPMQELIEAKRAGALPKLTDVRPDLSEALDGVIQRATAPDPNDRFHEIGDLVLAVRAANAPAGDSRPQVPLGLVGRNPYKGLAAFDEADAVDFFGRDELVDRLHGHATRSRFLAVVGPSGSGKSSAVRAGLAPRLRAGGAYVVSMVPGQHPMAELTRSLLQVAPASHAKATQDALRVGGGLVEAAARCLPDGAAELILIVDQFEELFTVSDETERDEFLRAIATAAVDDAGRVRVVVTIRADFYDRPLSHRLISDLVQANTIAVTPLSPAELERAITGPAARVGLAVESGLVAALIADSAGAPASLPLVQYKLTHMVDDRYGDELTLAAYERHGGLSGAVARRADELYEGYGEAGREDVRRLFGRLVLPGEGAEDTRRRVRRSEIAAISPDVITAYGDARLLTFDHDSVTREPTVEVAHEALIREWPRLRRWLDADRDGLRIMRHAASAAEAWTDAEHDPDELYRGGRLDTLEEWAAAKPGTLNQQEQDFLEASVAVRDATVVEQKQRYDQQLRSNRRLRRLLTGVGLLAVISLVAGLIAFQQGRRADDEAAEAEFGRLIARARTLPAQDLPLALLAAVEAFELEDRAESRGALQEALMAEPRFAGRTRVLGDVAPSTEGPNSAWIFTSRVVPGTEGSEENLFNVASEGNWFDSRTLEPIGSVVVDERWHLVSSPDRSLIAAMWLEPPWDVEGDPRLSEVRLHDATGRQVASLPTTGQPSLLRFLDEEHLIVGDDAGITIWDLTAEEVTTTIAIPGSPRLDQADVSADGSLLVVSSPAWFSGRVMLLDLELATVVTGTVGSCLDRCPVRFDPSGERVAIGEPGGVVVRDVATWAVQTQVVAPDDYALAVDFSDDGTMLYLGTFDGDLTFYDSFTGERASPTIDVRTDKCCDVMTVPGGELITLSGQGVLQRWGVLVHGETDGGEGFMDRSGPFGTWVGSTEGFGIFSPDSSRFVRTNDPDPGWVTVYEPATGEAVEQFELAAGLALGIAAFSPDGERVAVARFSGEIAVYDAATFEPTGEVLPGVGFMFATFSPDGTKLAVGANRPPGRADPFEAHIWNIESGQVTPLELTVDFEAAGRPSWNPDGTQVAISDIVGGDAVFDAETGLQVGTRFSVRGQAEAREVIWEADGRHVLGVGDPGVSRWDVTTGERAVPFTDVTSGMWMDLADDGALLVTASELNQARLWDLHAGVPLGAPFPDPGLGRVASDVLPPVPALSPDGRFLALTGSNGSVLWSLDPELWRDRACELAGRNMMPSEWANVMGDITYRVTCDQWPAG